MADFGEIYKKSLEEEAISPPTGGALDDWYSGAGAQDTPASDTIEDWYAAPAEQPSPQAGKWSDLAQQTNSPIAPSAKEELKKQMPWWYRAVTFGTGLLEPLQAAGDLLRSGVYDLLVRRPGERSEFLKTLSQLPIYAPWGDKPERVAPGDVMAERLFGAKGTTKNAAGFVLELLVDPFVFADIGGTLLARGAEKGAVKFAARASDMLGREVKASELLRAADQFDVLGDDAMAEISRLAAQHAFGKKLRSPALFIPEPARVAIGKTLVNLMDKVPSPFWIEYVGEKGVYKHRLSLAEATLTPQALSAAYADTPMGEAMRRLYGAADVTDIARGEVNATPAILDRAKQKALHFNALALEAIKAVPETFKKYTGLSPTSAPNVYDIWSKSTAELLDNLMSGPKLVRDMLESGKKPDVAELLDFSKGQSEYYERLKKIAKLYGADEEALFKAGMDVAKRQLEITTELGWTLSGMDDYNKLIDRVAKSVGADKSEVAIVAWKKAFNRKLSENEEKVFEAMKEAWNKDPVMKFYSVNPLTYLQNVADGYFRRVMGINIQDENFMRGFLETVRGGTRWVPAQDIRADEFVDALERIAGKEQADKVADFLHAYGDGTISPEMIEHYTGVPSDAIVKTMREVVTKDMTRELKRKITAALEGGTYAGKRPAASLIGKKLFGPRKVEEEELAKWLPLARLEERAAGMAAAGRRAISGQEVLRVMWRELGTYGLIGNTPDALKRVGVRNAVKIPPKEIYGPLAGKYIPRYFADQILRAVQSGDIGVFRRALNNLRVMFLANPGTIARNIGGGVTAMHAAGLKPQEIVTYGQKAARDMREIMKTRDLRALGPGWEQLKLYGEGDMAAEAGDILLRGLEDIMKKAGKPTNALQAAMEQWGNTAKNLFTGKPLFGVFQMSEDVMRVTTFYALRDRFLREGIDKNTAGILAAQYANNILFDYSNQPYMVQWLKRWGLGLFPSFPYFNLSRTASLIAKRPVSVSTVARISTASDQFLPEKDRRQASYIINDMWLRDEAPVLITTGEPGRFVAVPIKYMFPQLAGSDLFTDSLGEMAGGGIFQTLIDISAALYTGEGKGPYGERYGKEVFSPALDRTPLQRGLKSLEYAASGYAPGHLRLLKDAAVNMTKFYRSDHPEILSRVYADDYGYGAGKVIAKAFGFNPKELGPANYIENWQRTDWEFDKKQQELSRKLREAIVAGDKGRATALWKQKIELTKAYLEAKCRQVGGHWQDGRCQ